MRHPARHLIALAAAGLLAACAGAGGTTITKEYRISTYDPQVLTYPAKYGALKAEIVGDPFQAGAEQTRAATLAALQSTSVHKRVPIKTDVDAEAAKSPYRLVVLFDPALSIGRADVCAGSREQDGTPGQPLQAIFAFCNGERVVSGLTAVNPGIASLASEGFRDYVRQATAALLPRRVEDPGASGDDWNE